MLRFPLSALPLILGELFRNWQERNSRRPDPNDGPIGPVFDLPVGPFSGLTGEVYERQVLSMAPNDGFNFNGIPGFFSDTGWVQTGGLGIIPVARMVQIGSENTAGPRDGSPDVLTSGFSGQRWELYDSNGNKTGEIPNGDQITKTVAQTGSYFLIGSRITLGFRDLEGNPQPFPDTFPEPEPVPFEGPDPSPLRAVPVTAPPIVPEVAPPQSPPDTSPVPDRSATPERGADLGRLTPPLPQRGGSALRQPLTPAEAQALGPTGQPQLPPAPPIIPTRTGSTFLPGGPELPPNGPRPTPQGTADELGKLERKLELALAPDGPLSLLEKINKVIDQVENIKFALETLFPPGPYTFGPGAYQLVPVCGKDEFGNPLPALEAPWSGGEGENVEIVQRLDALAQLIQHHKDTGQPSCGGRGNGPGSNVTVHFESEG